MTVLHLYVCSFQLLLNDYTFLLFLVLMILFLVFTYFNVPETRGKTFEEIASQFQPGGNIEVEEVIEEEDEEALAKEEAEGDVFAEPTANTEAEDTRLVTLNFKDKSPTSAGEGDEAETSLLPKADENASAV